MKKIFILILLTIHLFGNTIEIAKDLFDNQKITYNNTTIKFQGQHQKSITIEGDSIDDNSFLIFKINGKDIEINDDINYLTYINVKESTANWIYGLSTIEVVNK